MTEPARPTEAQIAALVPAFYARVRRDPLLGPVFGAAVDDWDAHHAKLTAFWSSVMLTSGRYKGSPMQAHLKHRAAIRPEMFARWLMLWGETAREILPAAVAEAFVAKAERIAESLGLALWFRMPPAARSTAPEGVPADV
jgi:hemoglobin